MKSLHHLALLFLSVGLNCSFAQPIEDNRLEVVGRLQGAANHYFGSIGNVSYDVEVLTLKAAGKSLVSEKDAPRGKASILLSGEKYRIVDTLDISAEGYKNHNVVAYDGETYQRLRNRDLELYLKKLSPSEQRPSEYFLRYVDAFLNPFEFLSNSIFESDATRLEISQMLQQDTWKNLQSRLSDLEIGSADGKTTMTMTLKGGVEWWTQRETIYRVTFDTSNGMYPIKWERRSEDGNLIYQYVVDKLASVSDDSGSSILVPIVATKSFYGGISKFPFQSDPLLVQRILITNFKNNVTINDDEIFSIDPTLARTVYDANNGVQLKVPR